MSRIQHAYLILTGKLPTMEKDMLDNTAALQQKALADVQALVSALTTANNTIASQSQTISDLQSKLNNDATAADAAGVALMQPIVDAAAAALPPAQ